MHLKSRTCEQRPKKRACEPEAERQNYPKLNCISHLLPITTELTPTPQETDIISPGNALCHLGVITQGGEEKQIRQGLPIDLISLDWFQHAMHEDDDIVSR